MAMKLYPFQKEAVDKFFKVSNCRMIAALPTGAGKTLVAIAIMDKIIQQNPNAKILVVVPANLRNNLIENIKKFDIRSLNAVIIKSPKDLEESYETHNTFIMSYNFLRMYLNQILKYHWDMLVADEIHFAKNENTKNFKSLYALTGRVKCFLGLTASYVSNNMEEFFNIVALVANDKNIIRLGKHLIKYEIYGQRKASLVSKLLLNDKDIKGRPVQVGISDPLMFKRLVAKYIYLPKNEKILVVGKRPKPVSTVKHIILTKYEWKVYKYVLGEIPKPLLKLLASGDINDEQLRQIKNQIMALQQVLITPDYIKEGVNSKRPSSKVIACAKHIKENNSKAIVFTPFLEHGAMVVNDYFKSVGIKSELYAGVIKPKDRLKLQHAFESGEIDVLVLTTAGREGINLPSAKEVHFLSLTWNPEDLEQVMGRALRITSTNDIVNIYWYFAKGPNGEETIDDWMSRVLHRKRLLKKAIYEILSENSVAALPAYESLPKEKKKKFVAINGLIDDFETM
jgi:SNF2 family DNA or RNA helicase